MVPKVGDKGKGICSRCKEVVTTTCDKRVVPSLKERRKKLVSVCDRCDLIVGVFITSKEKGEEV